MVRSVLVLFLVLSLAAPWPVRAELISTSEALSVESEAWAVVDDFLAREEVAAELAALGVDPELARLRAASLTEAELEEVAGRIERAPAGGVSVIGVLGVTFLVLLILEVVGVIDIFKKV